MARILIFKKKKYNKTIKIVEKKEKQYLIFDVMALWLKNFLSDKRDICRLSNLSCTVICRGLHDITFPFYKRILMFIHPISLIGRWNTLMAVKRISFLIKKRGERRVNYCYIILYPNYQASHNCTDTQMYTYRKTHTSTRIYIYIYIDR